MGNPLTSKDKMYVYNSITAGIVVLAIIGGLVFCLIMWNHEQHQLATDCLDKGWTWHKINDNWTCTKDPG